MVTNIPTHAVAACVLRHVVFGEDSFPGFKKHSDTSDSFIATRIDRDSRDRACNLLSTTLISIDHLKKIEVAIEY